LLPIVIATGRDALDLQTKFKGEARMAFVAKPYTAQDLLGALRILRIGVTAKHIPPGVSG
jgi:hypothetical protein